MLIPFRVTHPGDVNGTVDAADYVVRRKIGGSPDDYNIWRVNFGRTFVTVGGAGTITSAEPPFPAVPEPSTFMMLMFATVGWCLWRCRTA